VDNWKSNKMRTLFGCGSLEYTYVYKFQDNRFYFNIKKSGFEVTVPALIKIFKQAIADVYHYLNFISLHLPHFPFFWIPLKSYKFAKIEQYYLYKL